MDSLPYRPMNAAARAAAMRAKIEGASAPSAPSAGRPRMPGGVARMGSASGQATYLTALNKLTTTTQKWLDNLDMLTENAVKNQKKPKAEDPASGDERVHKTPLYKLAARKKQAEDVVMKDAQTDDASSVGSNERIRPGTPTNMPKLGRVEPNPPIIRQPVNPVSPPARGLADMEIRSPQSTSNIAQAVKTEPDTEVKASEHFSRSQLFRPPTTAQTSVASIPPTPPMIITPPTPPMIVTPVLSPNEIPTINEPIPTSPKTTSLLTPLSDTNVASSPAEGTLSVTSDSVSTSSTKKRRISSKTVLESLMEKKSRNPIWYDGVAQKAFYEMVFEMSQQIQSMKRERRIVMFAKDPACGSLLDKMDNMLQKSLKTIECSSFMFLKGKPDLKAIESLKTDLKASLKYIEEFNKSGWTMANDDDDDEEEDSESDNDDESD